MLTAPSLYVGRSENGSFQVELRLLSRHFFVLSQKTAKNSKTLDAPDLMGIWYQMKDGAMLFLGNKQDFACFLNVGTGQDLYGDFSPEFGQMPQTLVLRHAKFFPKTYALTGKVVHQAQGAVLQDVASGLEFSCLVDAPFKTLPNVPFMLEANVDIDSQNYVRVKKIKSFSEKIPPNLQRFGSGAFASILKNSFWKLNIANLPPLSCITESEKTSENSFVASKYSKQSTKHSEGKIFLSGQGVHCPVFWKEEADQKIAFTTEDSPDIPQKLIHLFSGSYSWEAMEAVLAFFSPKAVFFLEKID